MLTVEELRKSLETGDANAVIGQFEGGSLECKAHPYLLDREEQKLELAKDVAGLANAEGGVILIGYQTERDAIHSEDRVAAVSPFPKALLDAHRYDQVLREWLCPAGIGIEICWFECAATVGQGVGAIFVSRAEEVDRPVLVAKTILEGRRRDIVFGYCERTLSHVVPTTVERLQALLRDGLRMDQELRGGIESIQVALADLRSAPIEAQAAEDRQRSFQTRLSAALEASGLNEGPALALAAFARRNLDLRDLFQSRSSRLAQLIDDPPQLRASGFDLRVGESSRIVEGRLRRAVRKPAEPNQQFSLAKLLELHRDGMLIYTATGDERWLCWGSNAAEPAIHPLVLVETTALFVKLAFDVFQGHVSTDDCIEFHLRLLRLKPGCRLQGGPPRGWGQALIRPQESAHLKIAVAFGSEEPKAVAFRLLSEVYSWFGFEADKIPFVTTLEPKTIDEQAIAQLR
jgi:hypothetical protein